MEPLVLVKWEEAGLWLVSVEGLYCNWTEEFRRATEWPPSVVEALMPYLKIGPTPRTLVMGCWAD